MTWKAVDGCARSRGSRSSSKAASGAFRPAVSASDQRLAAGRKHAAARVKTKPIPSSGSAWGSGTAAPPDPRIQLGPQV